MTTPDPGDTDSCLCGKFPGRHNPALHGAAVTASTTPEPDPRFSGELCRDCGKRNPMWFEVPDDIWNWITPDFGGAGAGLLCALCTDMRARDNGIILRWTADVYHDARALVSSGPAPTPTEPRTCSHPNAAFTIGGPEDSDGYVWCPDCRTNLSGDADDTPESADPTPGEPE